jgi:hypothetical protein
VAGAILGDWTHRRGDAGGSRALPADLKRARVRVAWTWEAPGGARIDQVRTAGDTVFVAAMGVSEETPGWEHATIYAIEGAGGKVSARRRLPDPMPVAALVVEGHLVHAVSTRPEEPVYGYVLTAPELRPVLRFPIPLEDARRPDVLDAWALADGGLWLELETGGGSSAFVALADPSRAVSRLELPGSLNGARDACEAGRSLFVPADPSPPAANGPRVALYKIEPERASSAERRANPRRAEWARVDTDGVACRVHGLAAQSLVFAALAGDGPRDLFAQVIALDRASGVERWKTPLSRFDASCAGGGARLAYVNGEVAMQRLKADGKPSSDLLLAGPRGSLEPALLGAKRRFVLDAALGGCLIGHVPNANGRALVAAFSVESTRGLLGRRARMHFSIETPDVGGAPAVYAGAGRILVRGDRRLVALGV